MARFLNDFEPATGEGDYHCRSGGPARRWRCRSRDCHNGRDRSWRAWSANIIPLYS